jgi:hypothetical protein
MVVTTQSCILFMADKLCFLTRIPLRLLTTDSLQVELHTLIRVYLSLSRTSNHWSVQGNSRVNSLIELPSLITESCIH